MSVHSVQLHRCILYGNGIYYFCNQIKELLIINITILFKNHVIRELKHRRQQFFYILSYY